MTISHDDLGSLVRSVFGETYQEIAVGLSAILIYKADPDNLDRLIRLLKEDGFRFPEGADTVAVLLKQRMDGLEAEVKV